MGARLWTDLRRVAAPFVVARVLVALAWVLADAVAAHDGGARPHQLDEGLLTWDGTWYRDIAAGGYDAVPLEGIRFFPLYPLLGRVLAATGIVSTSWALLLVANVAALALAVLVRRLVLEEGHSDAEADRAVAFVMLFPSAFVLVFAYAEAIMLCGVAGALLAARRRQWWWAALGGLVAAAARPLGVALAPALAVEALLVWRSGRLGRPWGPLAATVAPVAGVGAYLAWATRFDAGPLAPFTVQGDLRGDAVDPLSRLVRGVGDLVGPERFGDGLHLPFAAAFVVLAVLTFRRWPVSFGVYAVIVLVASLSAQNLNSLERYGLNALPIVLTLALLARTERVERVVLAISACGFVSLCALAWLGVYVP